MREVDVASEGKRLAVPSTNYVRFIILSGARTGSHMLAQALNSSPRITCFREVFNPVQDFIQFDVEGYDNFRARDISLRSDDPVRFLEERIFCRYSEDIRAVGFKLHYGQPIGFPGLRERLAEDREIRVIHLRRHSLLRMLVSLKLARETGVFLVDEGRKADIATLWTAARHPVKAAARLQRRLRPPKPAGKARRVKVMVTPEELYEFIVQMRIRAVKHEELFQEHPVCQVFYEDMVDRRREVFEEVQAFLGEEPRRLSVTLRKQNPEPLRELIENYEELYEALRDSPEAGQLE